VSNDAEGKSSKICSTKEVPNEAEGSRSDVLKERLTIDEINELNSILD
jgi:hypothetical protein